MAESTDRARRRTITCSGCGETAAHRGCGYCTTCYTRWVYHGRPAAGPPLPGATPRQAPVARPRTIPPNCLHGHRLDDTNLRFTPKGVRYCRACRHVIEKTYNEKQFIIRHNEHDVIPTKDGRRYCRTCNRGDHDIDAIVIERTAAGDRPKRVNAAELEAAVIRLRLHQIPYSMISQRTGCTIRHAWWICQRNGLTKSRQDVGR